MGTGATVVGSVLEWLVGVGFGGAVVVVVGAGVGVGVGLETLVVGSGPSGGAGLPLSCGFTASTQSTARQAAAQSSRRDTAPIACVLAARSAGEAAASGARSRM